MLAKRFEPMLRDEAEKYLEDRYEANVDLASLHLHVPRLSVGDVVFRRGRGVVVLVDGTCLSMALKNAKDMPPLFSIQKFSFKVDLGSLTSEKKVVDSVVLDGVQINVPPKGSRPDLDGDDDQRSETARRNVLVRNVTIRNALLTLVPADKAKQPLRFAVSQLNLKSVGGDGPMQYDGSLTNPKPPGQIHSTGSFGPWVAREPGDSRLDGDYTFQNADLGVFNGIAGILASKGRFEGTLSAITARGEATVPDFRLKSVGSPVPLWTRFECLVDGTNGNTILQPVRAKLGNTVFTTTGGVIKHEGAKRRSIRLHVNMPNGDMRDLLRLAMKGSPFMKGRVNLNTSIDIPPMSGPVKEKVRLDGRFDIRDAMFLRSKIQDEIDQLSRRGQGQPKNQEIDQVVSRMQGSFHLDDGVINFRSLSFGVPGADLALKGDYDFLHDALDFHGAVKLRAKVSDTMTGWKHWLLKPVDPFFAKNGAGTFLRIKVEGSSKKPDFSVELGGGKDEAKASPMADRELDR